MTVDASASVAPASAMTNLVGFAVANYMRATRITNRLVIDPPDIMGRVVELAPAIVTFWHGQHFMLPFFHHAVASVAGTLPVKVLISRHRDGDLQANAVERLGIGTVRGSGDHGREFRRKGGVRAFRELLDVLAEGSSVAMTADVPKVSRTAGLGIIMLARKAQRPIVPVSVTNSRAIQFDNWDHSTVGLPFGRSVIAIGETLTVPPDADEASMEECRRSLEVALDETTARAFALAGRIDKGARGRTRTISAGSIAESDAAAVDSGAAERSHSA